MQGGHLFCPHRIREAGASVMWHFKLILALVLIGLVVLFAVQNYEVVQLRLLFWSVEMSRALLLFLVLATGIGLGWIVRSLK